MFDKLGRQGELAYMNEVCAPPVVEEDNYYQLELLKP